MLRERNENKYQNQFSPGRNALRMTRLGMGLVAILALLLAAAPLARAEDDSSVEERLRRLEEKIGFSKTTDQASENGSTSGGGGWWERTSIGAYGEFIYNNVRNQDLAGVNNKDQFDARRVVLFVGHEFSDEWRFFSEIEIEHGDEIFLEQGFLDWQPMEEIGFQAGVMLIPLGIINVTHEPPTFHFSERPRVDTVLIPSTFRELGVQAYGRLGDLNYRLGVFNGPKTPGANAAGADTVLGTGDDVPSSDLAGLSTGGIRFIRQKGVEAFSNDFALAGSLDYSLSNELSFGTGAYWAEFDQNKAVAFADITGASLTIWEGHGRFQWEGLDLRGEYVHVWINDAYQLNEYGFLTSLTGVNGAVPTEMHGGYVEAAYDVLSLVLPDTEQRLYVAFRGEWMDLQEDLPSNAARNRKSQQREYNFGVAWKPLDEIIVKADYQVRQNKAAGDVPNQFNASVGFNF